ncbi:MAG: WYL domain-containing protein [Kiritimatiellae bacterium]|nr:WYL domain-containing protein [Kiritimatiellia bacterium]
MKKIVRTQQSRLRRMVEMIREGMAEGRLRNATDFQREFGVSRQSCWRDLDTLRDDEGAPVAYDASRRGFYLSDAEWRLPPVRLTRREVFAFSVAQRMLEPFRGTPLDIGLSSLFDKIADSLEGAVTVDARALTGSIHVVGEDRTQTDPEIWLCAAEAADRREVLHIRYRRFDGAVKEYRLRPVHLIAYHGDWYIAAFRQEREGASLFALSRILSIRASEGEIPIPGDWSAQAYFREAFGISHGRAPFPVRLRFTPKVSAYIENRVWHPDQTVRRRRDGSVDLAFTTSGWKELVRWVLSWQPDVKVLAPVRLRLRVEEKMREALGGVTMDDRR